MAQRLEWRFTDQSLFGFGNWYLDWGDSDRERLVTLSDVVQLSDNPAWCLREHSGILGKISGAVDDLLDDLAGLSVPDGEEVQLRRGTPMSVTVRRAYAALQHATVLLADAMVECRKGALEHAMRQDPLLSSGVAFALSDGMNGCYRLARYLPDQE